MYIFFKLFFLYHTTVYSLDDCIPAKSFNDNVQRIHLESIQSLYKLKVMLND